MGKLSKEAEKLREDLIELSTNDDEAFQAILETGLEAWDLMHNCMEIIAREGMTVTGDRGGTKAHPLLSVLRDARAQFLAAMKLLHLDEEAGEVRRPGKPTAYELAQRRR